MSTLDLTRNPELRDTVSTDYRMVTRRNHMNVVNTVKPALWAGTDTFHFIVAGLSAQAKDDIIAFLRNNNGQEITLLDYDSKTWTGIVVADPKIEEVGQGCQFRLTLVIEGSFITQSVRMVLSRGDGTVRVFLTSIPTFDPSAMTLIVDGQQLTYISTSDDSIIFGDQSSDHYGPDKQYRIGNALIGNVEGATTRIVSALTWTGSFGQVDYFIDMPDLSATSLVVNSDTDHMAFEDHLTPRSSRYDTDTFAPGDPYVLDLTSIGYGVISGVAG